MCAFYVVVVLFLYLVVRAILNCRKIVQEHRPNYLCRLGLMLAVTGSYLLFLAVAISPIAAIVVGTPYPVTLACLVLAISVIVTLSGACVSIYGLIRYRHVKRDDARSQACCGIVLAVLVLLLAAVPAPLAAIVLISAPSRISAHIQRNSQIRAYSGDGRISQSVRPYIPGLAETYGYSVAMPEFSRDRDLAIQYRLTNLPRWDRVLHVELRGLDPADQGHAIHCRLVDTEHDAVLAERSARVADLEPSHTVGAGPSSLGFRNILDYDLGNLPSTEHLVLELRYQLNHGRSAPPAAITIIVDTPLA